MKTLSVKMVLDSITWRWNRAEEIDTSEKWQSLMDNISGMKSLSIYMGSSAASKETLETLWDLAMRRWSMAWDRECCQ